MDYIYVYDSENKKRKMEVVSTFKIEEYPHNYIVYKELDSSKYYLAKYKKNSKKLITNISDKEYRLCKAIFEGLVG